MNNSSFTTKKIPTSTRSMDLKSKTLGQGEPSFVSRPKSKFRSLASSSFSSSRTQSKNSTFNNYNMTKISRISNLPTPREVRSTLTTRFASNKTQKLFEYYSILKQNYHSFTFDVPEKLYDKEFSRQFTRFTTAFDCFSRNLASVYGNVNPKNLIRNYSQMVTSSLYQSTKSLMIEWIDFIEQLNKISETGISPHISMTNSNLTVLFQNLATVSTIILVDKFKGDLAGQLVKSICSICLRIKDTLVEEYSKTKSDRFVDFDYEYFEEQCRRCSQLTASLFEQNMPPNSFTLTEMLSLKSGIINSISFISQILRSAMFFDDKIMMLKNSIIEFNNELNRVEQEANLQFAVELNLEEPKNDDLGNLDQLENESKESLENRQDENHTKSGENSGAESFNENGSTGNGDEEPFNGSNYESNENIDKESLNEDENIDKESLNEDENIDKESLNEDEK